MNTLLTQLLGAAEKADAIVIGPGLGQTPEAEGRLTRLVRLDKPMVVDADGLTILSAHPELVANREAPTVLTPMKPPTVTTGGSQPMRLAIAPNSGTVLYATLQGSNAVQAFPIDPTTFALTAGAITSTSGAGPNGLAVSPTGLFLYTANSGEPACASGVPTCFCSILSRPGDTRSVAHR